LGERGISQTQQAEEMIKKWHYFLQKIKILFIYLFIYYLIKI